ncbi:hypothetical protein M513_04147 [Trichuris suis]|uniref:Uncharacterized protein n=1 Tax=Trichuris suis TaxID=68888 RepID=A0A085MCL9_9BILA|nr:hypothetical protein M513_04147 [Trichuris suis]
MCTPNDYTRPPAPRVEESSGKWPLVSHSPVVVVSFSQRRKADIKKKWSTKLTSIETLQLQANNRKKGIAEHNYGRQSFPAKMSASMTKSIMCRQVKFNRLAEMKVQGNLSIRRASRNLACPKWTNRSCHHHGLTKKGAKKAEVHNLTQEVLLLSTVFIRGRETFCTCELSMICRLPKRNFNRRIPMQTKVILLRREKRALKSNPPL